MSPDKRAPSSLIAQVCIRNYILKIKKAEPQLKLNEGLPMEIEHLSLRKKNLTNNQDSQIKTKLKAIPNRVISNKDVKPAILDKKEASFKDTVLLNNGLLRERSERKYNKEILVYGKKYKSVKNIRSVVIKNDLSSSQSSAKKAALKVESTIFVKALRLVFKSNVLAFKSSRFVKAYVERFKGENVSLVNILKSQKHRDEQNLRENLLGNLIKRRNLIGIETVFSFCYTTQLGLNFLTAQEETNLRQLNRDNRVNKLMLLLHQCFGKQGYLEDNCEKVFSELLPENSVFCLSLILKRRVASRLFTVAGGK